AFFPFEVRKPLPLEFAHSCDRVRARRRSPKEVQVEPDHPAGCLASHVLSDRGAPIPTLDAIPGIPQAIHQDDERLRHTPRSPAPSGSRSRESKPGERRDDYVKGRHIRLSRLCQWLDESEELDDRPGPAVNEHQRYSVRARRALMNEVNLLAVNLY